MIFRQLFDKTSSTYTYLMASRAGGEALLIDPVFDQTGRYLKLLEELDLKLVKVIGPFSRDGCCYQEKKAGPKRTGPK